jgi:hypothetical protein
MSLKQMFGFSLVGLHAGHTSTAASSQDYTYVCISPHASAITHKLVAWGRGGSWVACQAFAG